MPQRNCHDASRNSRYVALLAAGFLALGLWQHLYFSYSVDQLTFFKNAFDEDTYLLHPFGPGGIRPDRLLSGTLVSGLLWLLQGSHGLALAVLDTFFPPLIFLAAYFVGAAIFREIKARCLFAILLALAPDLFSLGNAASYPGPFPTLDQFRALFGKTLVPPIETSFLALYRSPEPQISYAIVFCQIGLLLRFIFNEARPAALGTILGLAVSQALTMICYLIVAYPLLAFEGFAAFLLVLSGRVRKAVILGFLLTISIPAIYASVRLGSGGPTTGATMLFQSRMPEITVGVLSAAMLALLSGIMLLQRKSDLRLIAAFALAIVPLAIMNQQIVTGWMISGRDWERFINLSFVVVSGGILLSLVNRRRDWQGPVTGAAIIITLVFSTLSSMRTYNLWLADNLKSVAIARAIEAADTLGRDTLLVFEEPEYAPLVSLRTRRSYRPLLDYTEVFKNPIPATPEFKPTPLSASLFEYWRQTNVSPATAQEILQREALQKSGYYSGFIFNICEYWSPCTDGRNVQTEKIFRALPSVITSYEKSSRDSGAGEIPKATAGRHFAHVLSKSPVPSGAFAKIGEGRAGPFIAGIWVQN
ncbi:hypothetical protein [Bradyrhizobium sp.]|uniref:hypothetical protein n=1 Tax=Bradyrhizobium sp. TaxID=376 RepID=UPI001D648C8F|nr:hypothetical protein [Bradyrhizobium sp.]MBI5321094.1 hypothetical protein [Bradyrhizobium sp.]